MCSDQVNAHKKVDDDEWKKIGLGIKIQDKWHLTTDWIRGSSWLEENGWKSKSNQVKNPVYVQQDLIHEFIRSQSHMDFHSSGAAQHLQQETSPGSVALN